MALAMASTSLCTRMRMVAYGLQMRAKFFFYNLDAPALLFEEAYRLAASATSNSCMSTLPHIGYVSVKNCAMLLYEIWDMALAVTATDVRYHVAKYLI
jgi:hypothetical protein